MDYILFCGRLFYRTNFGILITGVWCSCIIMGKWQCAMNAPFDREGVPALGFFSLEDILLVGG